MPHEPPFSASPPANLIDGRWVTIPGNDVVSRNPAHPQQIVWQGAAHVPHVEQAVCAARNALPAWSRWPIERRAAVLLRFKALAVERQAEVASLLCDEVGKVMWEAKQEAALLGSKVDITLEQAPESGRRRVTPFAFSISGTREARALFRPHGVMAVLGPFNFPAHLPNGHIVPALLMGNTVVFKPSDKAPAVGQWLAERFHEALEAEGAPTGVFNLVQGGASVASTLANHDGLNGLLFTGSWAVGRRILEANLDRPGRMIALEMGGSNAAVVMPDANLKQAAIEVVRCAFNTCGQRCTSTRRLILHERIALRMIAAIRTAAAALVVGDPRAATPVFMGPIINAQMRAAVLAAQDRWSATGGTVILPAKPVEVESCAGGHFVSPGIVQVGRFINREDPAHAGSDEELFGPLLRISTVASLDEAVEQANATRFGLAASIFTRDASAIEHFLHESSSGCTNINTGTAGASSKLPFGGLGLSGNHRPAGAFSLDYTAYPMAAMVESGDAASLPEGMRFEDGWLE